MAFRIVTGIMGGGKSYMGMELALKAWKENRVVHTNIDTNDEEIDRLGFLEKFVKLGDDPKQWMGSEEDGSDSPLRRGREGQENIIIIDEGMFLFDAHDWQTTRKKHKALMEFLIWSRKLGFHIYLIGQAQKGMDVSFTRMALETVQCIACKHITGIGPFLVTLKGDFLRIYRFPTGQKTGKKEWIRFNPEVGALYKTESTHGKFANMAVDVGAAPVDEKKVRRRSWLKATVTVGCFLLTIWVLKETAYARFVAPALASNQPAEPTKAKAAEPTGPEVSLPKAPREAEAPKGEKMKIWNVSDRRKMLFWESPSGALVQRGAFYDESTVKSITMAKEIFTIVLADGRTVMFRPSTRADTKAQQAEQTRGDTTWKRLSSSPTWPRSFQPGQ